MYHDQLEFVYGLLGSVSKNIVLIEGIADDGVGIRFGRICANPDGADFSQIVVIAFFEDGVFLVGDHAAEIKDASIAQVVGWIEVCLRFDIDNDGDGQFCCGIECIKDDVKEVGIAVWVIAFVAQPLDAEGMIFHAGLSFDVARSDDFRCDIGEFSHR